MAVPTAETSLHGFGLLPSHIAQSILQLSVPSSEQNNLTLANIYSFQTLAHVSKLWRTLALDTASRLALSSLVLYIGNATRASLLEVRRKLLLQRTFLKTLDIQGLPNAGIINTDQWTAVLRCVPHLEAMKLDQIPSDRHYPLGMIVRAVRLQCSSLQSLVLTAPHRDNQQGRIPVDFQRRELIDPVYNTMERVYETTNHVGLRRLSFSMRYDVETLEATRVYLTKVLQFCPNLELFDGYLASVYALDVQMCFELWCMDMDLWERFCSTLTHLIDFSWICVPFATRFFGIFGQHPKPKLKKLILTAAMNWKWDRWMQEVSIHDQQHVVDTGYAGTAKNAHAALAACPNLNELRVHWHHQARPPVTETIMMNPEIFGDEFWEAAVQQCPLLSRITMIPACDTDRNPTIRTFTDRSLRALATLPWLEYVEMLCVNVTGDGIFTLAVHHASAWGGSRQYHLSLGNSSEYTTDTSFYDSLTAFLQTMLSADSPLPCMRRKVSMGLENERDNPVDIEWSKRYLAELKSLMQQVKAKHPGIQLNVFAHDCNGIEFTQISVFYFDTREELVRGWIEESDTAVGDGIWDRLEDLDEDDDDDDDDDYYSDIDAYLDDYYEFHQEPWDDYPDMVDYADPLDWEPEEDDDDNHWEVDDPNYSGDD